MLQVARLAPNLLHDSADSVAQFIQAQHHASGGFIDRDGRADLYYTVFGLECLIALQRDLPLDDLARYVRTIDAAKLDFVHTGCFARCFSVLRRGGHAVDENQLKALADQLEKWRTPDGGYSGATGATQGSAYGCFLAAAALQDLGLDDRIDRDAIGDCLGRLAVGDGSYTNGEEIPLGNTPATAAAVTLAHQFAFPIDQAKSRQWLLERCHAGGGFFALPEAPLPDLLSTAVALHALSTLKADIDAIREPCLDFIDTLWTSRGSFYSNWADEDDALDTEYTWYALLALGHLSV